MERRDANGRNGDGTHPGFREEIVLGDFLLAPSRHALTRDGAEVHLEPRALDLLIALVERRDRVVSKSELIETVWEGQFVSDSAVFKAVQQVRSALGDDGRRQRFVKTHHGRGYRYVGPVAEVPELRSTLELDPPRVGSEVPDEEAGPVVRGLGSPRRRPAPVILFVALLAGLGIVLLLARTPAIAPAAGVTPPEPGEVTASLEAAATTAESTGDLQNAIGHRRALRLLDPTNRDNVLRLLDLLRRAVRLSEAGELATELAARADEAGWEEADRLRLAIRTARVLDDRGRSDEALAAARSAVERAEELAGRADGGPESPSTSATTGLADALFAEAGIRARRRELEESDEILARLDDLLGPDAAPADRARLSLHQAVLARYRRDESRAHLLLERAERGFREAGDSTGLATVDYTRGLLLVRAGEMEEARNVLQRGLGLAVDEGRYLVESRLLLALGDVETDLGLFESALRRYERAERRLEPHGPPFLRGHLANALGIVRHQRGEPAAALRAYERAERIFGDLGSVAGSVAAAYNSVVVALESCRLDEARRILVRARAIDGLSASDRAAFDHLEGRVALEAGETAVAVDLLGRAARARDVLGEPVAAGTSRSFLASALLANGRATDAVDTAARAAEELSGRGLEREELRAELVRVEGLLALDRIPEAARSFDLARRLEAPEIAPAERTLFHRTEVEVGLAAGLSPEPLVVAAERAVEAAREGRLVGDEARARRTLARALGAAGDERRARALLEVDGSSDSGGCGLRGS